MNKKRIYLIIIGIVAIVAVAVLGCLTRGKSRPGQVGADSLDVQYYLDSLMLTMAPDTAGVFDTGTESVKMVDESVFPYLVPSLCGYNPRDLRMGVITVRRDIDPVIYAKAFPPFGSRPGQVDTISEVFMYIKPMAAFPDGECGRVAYILSNDSVIQIQFVRGGVDEMVSNVSSRLDDVSSRLQDLARQMQDNGKKD